MHTESRRSCSETPFGTSGILRLSGVFSKPDAAFMIDSIWKELARQGLHRDNPATWTIRQPTGFQALSKAGAFVSIAQSPILIGALDRILGQGTWIAQKYWGAPLVTFPEPGRTWDIPAAQWHLDFPAGANANPLPGVRILAFLHDVAPRAGGTLIVSGSHRIVERLAPEGHSAEIRDSLSASYPWFRDLWSKSPATQNRIERFMAEGDCIEGTHIRVEELTGVAGDVVLMHPWTFHAPAPNCGDMPRIMVSHSVFRQRDFV